MSIEQLLLIVAFVVLPLIQYLIRMARRVNERNQPARAESLPPAPNRGARRVLRSPAVKEHRTLSDAIAAPERKPARPADRQGAAAIRRSARRGTAALGLRDSRGLRRAIVLMTVLEPCRALDPRDSPEQSGRR
jgi:hypothetical protein